MAIIAYLGHIGVTDARVLRFIGDGSSESTREWIVTDLKVDPARPMNKILIAKLLDIWATAKKRVERQEESEAEQRTSKVPRSLIKGDHLSMRANHERQNCIMDDFECPPPEYVEMRLEQMEDGEIVAEQMTQVVSVREARDDTPDLIQSVAGVLKIKKGKNEVPIPLTSEHLRHRYRVMLTCWEFVKMRHGGRQFLSTLSAAVWREHVNWLLGPNVAGLEAKDENGSPLGKPSWTLLLSYEYEVRKRAYREINMVHADFAAALLTARTVTDLRQRFLLTPFSIATVSSSRMPKQAPWLAPPKGVISPGDKAPKGKGEKGKGEGKGKKGGGKGAGKDDKKGKKNKNHLRTPDGAEICFKFNRTSCEGECNRAHACMKCLGAHALKECPQAKQ